MQSPGVHVQWGHRASGTAAAGVQVGNHPRRTRIAFQGEAAPRRRRPGAGWGPVRRAPPTPPPSAEKCLRVQRRQFEAWLHAWPRAHSLQAVAMVSTTQPWISVHPAAAAATYRIIVGIRHAEQSGWRPVQPLCPRSPQERLGSTYKSSHSPHHSQHPGRGSAWRPAATGAAQPAPGSAPARRPPAGSLRCPFAAGRVREGRR